MTRLECRLEHALNMENVGTDTGYYNFQEDCNFAHALSPGSDDNKQHSQRCNKRRDRINKGPMDNIAQYMHMIVRQERSERPARPIDAKELSKKCCEGLPQETARRLKITMEEENTVDNNEYNEVLILRAEELER
jgi:hypothetical protein